MTAVPWKASVHPEREAGLMWAIAASAAVHAAVVAAVVLFPQRFGVGTVGMVSYTVELVGASDIGGTNLVAGRKAKPQPVAVARSVPERPQPAAPALPQPDVSGPETVPEAPAPAPQPAPELAGPPPPEPAPAEAPVAAKPDVVIPEPKPPPKPIAPAKALPIAKPPEPAKQLPPKPEAKPKPEVKAKPEPDKKPAVRAEEKAQPAASAHAAGRSARAPASQPKSAATPAVPAAKAGREAQARDEQIAAAVKRRQDEQRIADAVAKRAQSVRRGGGGSTGGGASAHGGPISSGAGVGSGGVLEAMEVVLYLSEIEKRTRANWVWAGADQSLEAKVQFEITDEGQVRNVRTVSSSGDHLYDASAERAVWAASPLPPPPVKYRERFVDGVELTFRPEDLDS